MHELQDTHALLFLSGVSTSLDSRADTAGDPATPRHLESRAIERHGLAGLDECRNCNKKCMYPLVYINISRINKIYYIHMYMYNYINYVFDIKPN